MNSVWFFIAVATFPGRPDMSEVQGQFDSLRECQIAAQGHQATMKKKELRAGGFKVYCAEKQYEMEAKK